MKIASSGKIVLKIHGVERIFTEKELTNIVESYYAEKADKKKLGQYYVEGNWFLINPNTIDRSLFVKERNTDNQERTRKIILEAFDEMDKNPKKYARKFKTRVLSKEVGIRCSVYLVKDYITPFGDKIANWVEQALEWAQRIANGESWQSLCEDTDNSIHFRLIMWKNGYASIGGSQGCKVNVSATNVWELPSMHYDYRYLAPVVVKYL